MITPLDIQHKEFAKAVRGYKEEEVDSFLDLVTLDFEKLLDENKRLKESVIKLSEDLTRYQKSEGAVLDTLEAAKGLMRDISSSAEKRAEILLKNAELDAQVIQREAKESVERLTEEAHALKHKLSNFKSKYKSFLEEELNSLDSLGVELFLKLDSDENKIFSDIKTNERESQIPSETKMMNENVILSTRRRNKGNEDIRKTISNLK